MSLLGGLIDRLRAGKRNHTAAKLLELARRAHQPQPGDVELGDRLLSELGLPPAQLDAAAEVFQQYARDEPVAASMEHCRAEYVAAMQARREHEAKTDRLVKQRKQEALALLGAEGDAHQKLREAQDAQARLERLRNDHHALLNVPKPLRPQACIMSRPGRATWQPSVGTVFWLEDAMRGAVDLDAYDWVTCNGQTEPQLAAMLVKIRNAVGSRHALAPHQ